MWQGSLHTPHLLLNTIAQQAPLPAMGPGCERIHAFTSAAKHPDNEDIVIIESSPQGLRRVIPVGTAQFTDWLITGFVGGSAYLILMQMQSQIEEGPGHLDQKVFMPSDQSRQALAFRCLIPELAAGRYDLQVSVHDASKLSEVVCVTDDANQGMIFSYLITKIGLIYLNIRSILTMTDAYLRHASIRGINH